jgi:methionyl-tRNA formyltransferase
MRVVRELDAGPMLAIERRAIGPDETSADVEHALAEMGAALAADTVERLSQGPVPEEPQPDAGVTYADRISKGDSPSSGGGRRTSCTTRSAGCTPGPTRRRRSAGTGC